MSPLDQAYRPPFLAPHVPTPRDIWEERERLSRARASALAEQRAAVTAAERLLAPEARP